MSNQPLRELLGYIRANRLTKKYGVFTAGEANGLTDDQILSLNGVGRIALNRIRNNAEPTNNNKHNSLTLSKMQDNEPIFVLRAQDRSAPSAILHWMSLNEATLPDGKLEDAFETMMQMRHWKDRKKAD